MKEKKIAVISGINANIHALKAFLKYADNNGIERVFNLGNFIKNGPNPKEVAEVILNDKRFVNLVGMDEWELIFNGEESLDEYELWTFNKLDSDTVEKIRNLTFSTSEHINGKKVLLMSTNLSSYEIGREEWTTMRLLLSDRNRLTRVYAENAYSHDYIFCSRNGVQEYRVETDTENHPVATLTPGNLACFYKNRMAFAVVVFREDEIDVVLKNVAYDVSKVFEDMYEKELPNRNYIIGSIYGIDDLYGFLRSNESLKKYTSKKCDIVIRSDKAEDGFGIKYADAWKRLILLSCEGCTHAELCCFKSDEKIMNETKSLSGYLKSDVYGCDQVAMKCFFDEEVRELLLERFVDGRGRIKWFEMSLTGQEDEGLLSFRHFGTECCIYGADNQKRAEIISFCNKNGFRYFIDA